MWHKYQSEHSDHFAGVVNSEQLTDISIVENGGVVELWGVADYSEDAPYYVLGRFNTAAEAKQSLIKLLNKLNLEE